MRVNPPNRGNTTPLTMSESETETEESSESNEVEMSVEDLDESELESLLKNPEVQKTIKYENSTLSQIIPMLENLLEDEEVMNLFVSGVADRSGRRTEQTVRVVLENAVAEYREAVSEE